MSPRLNRLWRFAAYPQGMYAATDFRWCEEPLPPLADGEVRVRNLLLSLDPTNRAWGFPKETYMPKLEIGDVMRGIGIGIVEESRHPGFPPGAYVAGLIGWQEYLTTEVREIGGVPEISCFERDPGTPLDAYLGLYGFIGLTAYFGLFDLGQPRPGDTVVVSAAAGATGSLVAQLARIARCRVVGIAGGDEKCGWLRDELGLDAVIDYKRQSLAERLPQLCPEGIDVYYDNVGGSVLEAALENLALGARVVVAGMIAMYNDPAVAGPRNLVNLILKRARMQGFVVFDFMRDGARVARAMRDLRAWHESGRLRYRSHVVDGLEQAPKAINMLFTGENRGKLMVRIAPDPVASRRPAIGTRGA